MKCPKCGSHEVNPAGGDWIVNLGEPLFSRVDFWRCAACGHFDYEDRFDDDDEEFDVEAYSNKDISEDLGYDGD